ncbi:hypothetical protein HN604_03600 [archaeon]|jgi:hypothetical protein|nr:hypothetical protein [archaeon]MBT6182822.1 hypothetical protein [archaeon]MBT6606028.1 hypothetical protein [archaeon]MBT7251671.1 hypothetical protein [archaeon]MBT7661138.1 hypothetical protein [archaeon]
MAEQKTQGDNLQFLMSDFNTRLRDLDERNRLIRERVLLLGKNIISSRQELDESMGEIKKENQEIKRTLEKLQHTSKLLITEINKFVKREEMGLVERMLKDFQPLEFMRKKDIEKMIEEKMASSKKD